MSNRGSLCYQLGKSFFEFLGVGEGGFVLVHYMVVFGKCPNLTTVELVGKINNSVAYITMDIWRNQMTQTTFRINCDLHTTRADAKTMTIIRWISDVQERIMHFKMMHSMWLTRATTLLELAM